VAKVYSSILSFFPPTEAKIYQRKVLLHGLPNNGVVLRLDVRWVTVTLGGLGDSSDYPNQAPTAGDSEKQRTGGRW
jgi:hypothetical protein